MADIEKQEEKMVISTEDATNIRNFFKFFNVPVTDYLEVALTNFEKEQNFQNQQYLKVSICKVIATTNHPVFTDSMVKTLFNEAAHLTYHEQFDKDFVEVIAKTKDEE